MKKLLLAAMSAFTILAQAQDLVITYDFIRDKYEYRVAGTKVDLPIVKRNYEVKVIVTNLNPYVFQARCNWKQQISETNSSVSGLASMFSGLAVGGVGSISTLLNGLNMKEFEEVASRSSNGLFNYDRESMKLMQNAVSAYNDLVALERSLIRMQLATQKMQKLKRNPYLPSDTLKKIAAELTASAISMNENKPLVFTASNFVNLSSGIYNRMQEDYVMLENNFNSFSKAYDAFAKDHGTDFPEVNFKHLLQRKLDTAALLLSAYSVDKVNERVEALEMEYEAIYYTPFTYTCNYMATGDAVSLELDFFENSRYTVMYGANAVAGGDALDTLRKIRTKTTNILVKGDMKIITSIGLGFPTYFDNNKTWTNRDSLVYGAPGNNYAPCISTYISFYPYAGKNVHWGGTFGIGIPVQNEGTSAMNFFLGGSAVMGTGSKVVLHGGLSIGQLSVLSGGTRENDNLGDETTLPETKKAFKPGAFFGISFAINR